MKQKILAILLTSAPYGNQYADHMCRVALRALEKGYAVEIFLYGEGVHSQMSHQSPDNLFPVGDKIMELMAKGSKVYSCDTCSEARGFGSGRTGSEGIKDQPSTKVMNGVEMATIYKLVEMLVGADKVLSFGGG